MVIGEIATGLSIVNGAVAVFRASRDALRALLPPLDRETRVGIEDRIDEMSEAIRKTKDAYDELYETAVALREENARLAKFQLDEEKYEMRAISPHSFVYVAKGVGGSKETTPYLCVACFENKRRSVLQIAKTDFHFDTLHCPACGGTVRVPNDRRAEAMVVRRQTRADLGDF